MVWSGLYFIPDRSQWGRVGFRGGGAKGAEAPPLQVNEMRNIHFGQNTNSFK